MILEWYFYIYCVIIFVKVQNSDQIIRYYNKVQLAVNKPCAPTTCSFKDKVKVIEPLSTTSMNHEK